MIYFRKPSIRFGSTNTRVTTNFKVLSGEILYLAGQKKKCYFKFRGTGLNKRKLSYSASAVTKLKQLINFTFRLKTPEWALEARLSLTVWFIGYDSLGNTLTLVTSVHKHVVK